MDSFILSQYDEKLRVNFSYCFVIPRNLFKAGNTSTLRCSGDNFEQIEHTFLKIHFAAKLILWKLTLSIFLSSKISFFSTNK